MTKRGMPGLVSGDAKAPSPLSAGHKQVGHEALPSRHAKSQLVGGDLAQRTLGNYGKMSPVSVTGVGNAAQTINTMPMMGPQVQ